MNDLSKHKFHNFMSKLLENYQRILIEGDFRENLIENA